MPISKQLLAVRDARQGKLRAKVGDLRGGLSGFAEFPGSVLMLDGLRALLAVRMGYSKVVLVRQPKGFALCIEPSHCERIWLIAERTKRVRIFKSFDAAAAVCGVLGATDVRVELVPPQPRVVQGLAAVEFMQ